MTHRERRRQTFTDHLKSAAVVAVGVTFGLGTYFGVAGRLSVQDTKVSAIENDTSELEQRVDELEGVVQVLPAKVEGIEVKMDLVADELRSLSEFSEQLEDSFNRAIERAVEEALEGAGVR